MTPWDENALKRQRWQNAQLRIVSCMHGPRYENYSSIMTVHEWTDSHQINLLNLWIIKRDSRKGFKQLKITQFALKQKRSIRFFCSLNGFNTNCQQSTSLICPANCKLWSVNHKNHEVQPQSLYHYGYVRRGLSLLWTVSNYRHSYQMTNEPPSITCNPGPDIGIKQPESANFALLLLSYISLELLRPKW